MGCHYDPKHLHLRLLPAINEFLSLGNRESVILSIAISAHV